MLIIYYEIISTTAKIDSDQLNINRVRILQFLREDIFNHFIIY